MTTPPLVKPDPDRQDPLAHVKEFPDYYERLKRMEAEAERAWAAETLTGPYPKLWSSISTRRFRKAP